LRSIIVGWTPFGWLFSITLIPYFWWKYNFLFTSTFLEKQQGRRTSAGCILIFMFLRKKHKDKRFWNQSQQAFPKFDLLFISLWIQFAFITIRNASLFTLERR
jgi:hypothetical protein